MDADLSLGRPSPVGRQTSQNQVEDKPSIANVFSCDVEDWYQSCFDFDAPISDRCLANVERCLTELNRFSVKGTFFIQGKVAQERPEIVKCIMSENHEIQYHGYSHRPLHKMTKYEFRDDFMRGKEAIESITNRPITAYRAPDFTIVRDNLWVFDIMAENGIRLDSSIFPMRTRRYGIAAFALGPSYIRTKSRALILEVPVSVLQIGWLRVPVGGGGYFRLWPTRFLTEACKIIMRSGRPFVIYCHPYEFDPKEWEQISTKIPFVYRTHQGLRRRNLVRNLRVLLSNFRFSTFESVFAGQLQLSAYGEQPNEYSICDT